MECVYRYCPQCKVDTSEVVLAGERLKESKKKCKMVSSQSATSRDWGKVVVLLFIYYLLTTVFCCMTHSVSQHSTVVLTVVRVLIAMCKK